MSIPQPKPDQRGWSVEANGMIHLRYASDHAPRAVRAGTVKGVETLLDGVPPKACHICFPHGNRQRPNSLASRGQKRRR